MTDELNKMESRLSANIGIYAIIILITILITFVYISIWFTQTNNKIENIKCVQVQEIK